MPKFLLAVSMVHNNLRDVYRSFLIGRENDSIRSIKPSNAFIMRSVMQLVIIMIIVHERKENEHNDYNDILN